MKALMNLWKCKNYIIGWLTPFLWSPFLFHETPESKCAYVVLIMITYWFLEIVPISVTSLIPVLLFPLVGVLNSHEVSKCYFNTTLMIFLGSLVAATAVEKSNLHTRVALKVILMSGTSPRRLLFGFMITTCFLSLWISNLATVALMIPIVNAAMDKLANRRAMSITIHNPPEAVTISLDEKQRVRGNSLTANNNMISVSMSKRDARRLRKGILLGVCYAANIGGTGTLTGTSTNLVLNSVLKEQPVSFSQWFFFNIPGLCLSVFLTWVFVSIFYLNVKTNKRREMKEDQIREAVKLQYEQLGSIRFNELAVLCLFGFMLSLWFFRNPDFMPGWTKLFTDDPNFILDQVPAILVCIMFFLIPKDPWNLTTSPPLLDWKTTQERVSWGVILLLGGGFAMAKGCDKSGLSLWISNIFTSSSASLPTPLMCLILLFVAGIMTEPTSNTAACTVLLPVVKHIAKNMNVDPLYFMLPVTVVCSYATMLPVASGTNAIVFETAKMRNKDMIFPGFFVKIIATLILFAMTHTWGVYLFDFKY